MSDVRTERGASALVVAGSLILLLGMAAIAIDVGAAFNERRQNQSAADVGVLAGVLSYPEMGECGSSPGPDDAGCNQLLGYVQTNLTTSFSPDDWIDAWRTCLDPDRPEAFDTLDVDSTNWPGFVDSDGTPDRVDCISWSGQELRVWLPDQILATTFGRVLGVQELTTLAVAQAALEIPGLGGLLPFGILSGSGSHTCLLTGPAGTAEPPCDGAESGNFFTIESQTWGPPSSTLTQTDCGNPGSPELAINTAIGIDHFLARATEFSPPDPDNYSFDNAPKGTADDLTTREDRCIITSDGTPGAADRIPNAGPRDTIQAATGADDSTPVLLGLITGQPADFSANAAPGVTITPRLLQNANCKIPNGNGCATRVLKEKIQQTTREYEVNNEPLWSYLLDSALTPPVTCGSDTLVNTSDVDSTEEMICLLDAIAGGHPVGEVFDDSIETNPRFARVPEFYFTEWGSGTHWQPIENYRMVFLHSVWFSNENPGFEFLPTGETNDPAICFGNNQNNCQDLSLLQLEAFLLPADAVPDEIVNSFPGGDLSNFPAILTQ